MDAPYQIRRAGVADVPAIVDVERACFNDPWSARSIQEAIQSETSRAFVAEKIAGLVGYVLARISGREGEILDLAVRPGARRQGIARRLLGAAMDSLRDSGVEEVYLEVRESNRAAIALYRAEGYRPAGMRTDYYRNPPEAALVLRVAISPRGFSSC
ncbi:MAG TPA: ribosomal protein S18-alanine N-acetyltransferase [Gemmatimonadales bacterium]|nr:ribosomal protein S18-alanine N-acetyltransferase [Gemmatimonadales bacterium]